MGKDQEFSFVCVMYNMLQTSNWDAKGVIRYMSVEFREKSSPDWKYKFGNVKYIDCI